MRAVWPAAYLLTRGIAIALLVPQIELLADFTNYGQALAHGGATGSLFEYPWLAACALTQLLHSAHRAELSGSEPQARPLAALTLRNVLLGAISVRVALQISREPARHG